MTKFTLPLQFDADAVPASLARLSEIRGVDELELEVLPGAVLEPAALALMASFEADRASAGRPTRWRVPEGPSPTVGLEPITDLRLARRLGERMADSLERALPAAAPSVVRASRFVFEELGANVVQHSARPETGFGVLAARPELDGGRFQAAFCDAGRGFLASLSQNPELSGRVQDDFEAIQLAVERGLSGIGGRSNMGMGLGVLNDLSDRLGADLRILSGEALWHRRTVGGQRVATLRPVPRWHGAWICFDAPAFPSP